MMDFAFRSSSNNVKRSKELKGIGIGFNSDALVIVKLPHSRALRVMSRSLFLAVVILALPSIGPILEGSSDLRDDDSGIYSDPIGFESLPKVFHDLAAEGLLRSGDKGLIVSSGSGDLEELQFLYDNDIDLVMESDLDRQSYIPSAAFDYVFTSSFQDADFIDRILKIGGIVVTLLSADNPSNGFQRRSNYKIVYLRRFDATVVAMRKTVLVGNFLSPPTKPKLCGFTPEAKKTALKGLEEVMLEPPRRALAKSSNGERKIKFLPDLLGDSLKSYRRRVFITDEKTGAVEWFRKNYPRSNQDFEIYALEFGADLCSIGMSDWLRKNVRKEDYVVMKAEAGVVEEMMKKNKAICWVDELFLECKNQWEDGGEGNGTNRAYWQCLALYGSLRDEGIAVHQWLG